MKKLEAFKAILKIAVSAGVGVIVGNAIKATTPDDMKRLTKLGVSIGSLVLTGIASDMASKYVDEQVDDMVASVKEVTEGATDSDCAAESNEGSGGGDASVQ